MENCEGSGLVHRFEHAFFHERHRNCLGLGMGMHRPKLPYQLQQWCLLCNGFLLLFDELLPFRLSVLPHRLLPARLSVVLPGK
jgi:hypothetical protein